MGVQLGWEDGGSVNPIRRLSHPFLCVQLFLWHALLGPWAFTP